MLGVRRRPVRKRHRNDDRTQARSVLEIVLVLHKSRVLIGEYDRNTTPAYLGFRLGGRRICPGVPPGFRPLHPYRPSSITITR